MSTRTELTSPIATPTPDHTTERDRERSSPALSRRDLIVRWGGAVCASPAIWVLGGCVGGKATQAALPGAAGQASGPGWLSGGTARIGAAARTINPFLNATATTCKLTCEATIGPCHTLSPERRDISDSWDGLPMHMQLRIVDTQCRPIENAIVEVWHTNHTGGYSGRMAPMCNNDKADVERQFFRGWQRKDTNGIARFDSCYPGWYGGRANHVHLRLMKGDYDRAIRPRPGSPRSCCSPTNSMPRSSAARPCTGRRDCPTRHWPPTTWWARSPTSHPICSTCSGSTA